MAPGPAAMLLGYLLMGLLPVLVRLAAASGWSGTASVVARFSLGCAFIVAWVLFGQRSLVSANRWALFWRGVLGGAAVLTYFIAVELTSAATGTLLNYTHSIWANVFSAVFLGRRVSKTFWALLLVASAGMWLVLDPSLSGFSLGELVGVASGVFGGAAVLTIKELRKTDEAVTILASFSLFGLLVGLTFLPFESAPFPMTTDGRGLLALLGIGVFSFFGQLLYNHGFRETSVQLGTVMSLCVPVIAAASGWLVLGEALTLRFALGAGLVLTACALTAYVEQKGAPRV
jgi:drug/metabolite transporter (DMT)-like permease